MNLESRPISDAQLRVAEARNRQVARDRGNTDGKISRTGRLVRQVSMEAFMNAVNTEGRAVLSPEASGYWRDMDRRYPFIAVRQDRGGSGTAMRNRFGKVSLRIIAHSNGTREEIRRP
jgi:hypothetical protein